MVLKKLNLTQKQTCISESEHTITEEKQKLVPYGDWQSTLRNWRLRQLQSHV